MTPDADLKQSLVLDSTILVSAFLTPGAGGPSSDLIRLAAKGMFDLYLSTEILDETERVLRASPRLRKRYLYSDAAISSYREHLSSSARLIRDLPRIRVVRDPNDDMILACVVAAKARFLVTRDLDLLSMGRYGRIHIVAPEDMLHILRGLEAGEETT
jgi:putative PIN family toxin of toxin-antitoxin system